MVIVGPVYDSSAENLVQPFDDLCQLFKAHLSESRTDSFHCQCADLAHLHP